MVTQSLRRLDLPFRELAGQEAEFHDLRRLGEEIAGLGFSPISAAATLPPRCDLAPASSSKTVEDREAGGMLSS